MPEPTVPPAPPWGVTVESVVALASQAHVDMRQDDNGDIAVQVTNEVFESRPKLAQKITKTQVKLWIDRVAAQVGVTLHRLHRIDETKRVRFAPAVANVVELGAAAYLVDAAYPQRSGVNDQASYGDVLWTRHRQALTDLGDALEAWLDSPGDDDDHGGHGQAAGGFPPAMFTDSWVRESHPHLQRPGGPYAPGAEYPVRW